MTIKDSKLAGKANYTYNVKFGDLYFYDFFFIAEMKEGVVITKEDAVHMLDLVHVHFGYDRPYGLISNRVNSYSSDLIDISQAVSDADLLVANAVVIYNTALYKGHELENRMLKLKAKVFYDINEAIVWTKNKVEQAILSNK